jgi:hypothetical protein
MIRSNLFGFGDILLSHEALQQRHRASMSLSLSDQEKYVGPTPRRRFAKLSVRNYHSTRHSSTKPNIRIDPVSPLPVLRSMADCDVILQDRDAPLDQEMRQLEDRHRQSR